MLYFNSLLEYTYCINIEKDIIMRGSIRASVGFLITFGAVGGMESPENSLIFLIPVAVVGLLILASGVSAISKESV